MYVMGIAMVKPCICLVLVLIQDLLSLKILLPNYRMDTRASILAIMLLLHQTQSMTSTKGVVQSLEHHEVVMIQKRLLTTFRIGELIR